MSKIGKQSLALPIEGKGPHNLAAELRARLPEAQIALLERIVAEAGGQGLYLVGGPVRDLLLGQASLDFDLVLEGKAIPLARRLAKTLGGAVTAHKRFGTAAWVLGEARDMVADKLGVEAGGLPESVDLISARRERYPKSGALPEVEFATIGEDTQRRDFTLNTLALRLDGEHFGELLDLWGGLDDLKAGRLRALHARSFVDDPTRILRILRFEGRLGFEMEAETLKWLKEGLPYLEKVSGERMRNELDYVAKERQRVAILERMQALGVLKAIHPALRFDAAAAKVLGKFDGKDVALGLVLWLTQLDPEAAMQVAERLRLEAELVKAIRAVGAVRPELGALSKAKPSEAVARLEGAPELARAALLLGSGDEGVREMLGRYEAEWRDVQPKTDGHALQARGLKPGPRYKEILWRLRAAWLDGDVKSEKEEEALLEELLHGDAED
jgi:tRNA nucleotidyltransferase (CCA-adding enzyme)